jgi:hypothetical protein
MEKFLKFPISGSTYQLVSITDVVIVEQASATTTTIQYKGAGSTSDVLTITHASVANDNFRDFVQNQIESALTTCWTKPVYTVAPPVAVSQIALA